MDQFDIHLKEVFEIIKNENPRALKQFLSFNTHLDLENFYYQRFTPLLEAVFLERYDMVQFICLEIKQKYTKQGFLQKRLYHKFINALSSDQKSALHIATLSNEHSQIIKFLIQEGANTSLKDKENYDVFYYAQYAMTEEIETFWNNYHH